MTSSGEKITVTIDADLEDLIPEFMELTKNDVVEMKNAGINLPDYSSLETIVEVYNNCEVRYKPQKGLIPPPDKKMTATISNLEPIKALAKNQNKSAAVDTMISIEKVDKSNV